jgi:DeoR/GlpR family transcriptional regulator of sugar metabolism
MLSAARHQRILDFLRAQGSASVHELVRVLNVSDMTVRRDLSVLHKQGQLRKIHGGALLDLPRSFEPHFTSKRNRNVDEKSAIAKEAVALVPPRAVVGLGAGTTTWYIAKALRDRDDLTFITNSTNIALELDTGRAPVMLIGGNFRTPSDALVGPVAVWALERLNVDILFLGVHGVELTAGYTTPNVAEAETDGMFIRRASRVVVVADHTKFGVTGVATIAPVDAAHVLITDSAAPAKTLATIRKLGVDVIVASSSGGVGEGPHTKGGRDMGRP